MVVDVFRFPLQIHSPSFSTLLASSKTDPQGRDCRTASQALRLPVGVRAGDEGGERSRVFLLWAPSLGGCRGLAVSLRRGHGRLGSSQVALSAQPPLLGSTTAPAVSLQL